MTPECSCGSGSSKSSVTNVSIFSQTPRQAVYSSGVWSLLSHQLPGVLFAGCSRWVRLWGCNNCKINILRWIYVFDHTNISRWIFIRQFHCASLHKSPAIGLVLHTVLNSDLIQPSSQREKYIYCLGALLICNHHLLRETERKRGSNKKERGIVSVVQHLWTQQCFL